MKSYHPCAHLATFYSMQKSRCSLDEAEFIRRNPGTFFTISRIAYASNDEELKPPPRLRCAHPGYI